MSANNNVNKIDALLPQTQCGLCGYKGCRPYATAIANGEASINLCPPGGVTTLLNLSEITGISAAPFLKAITENAKPPSVVRIREAECIGCVKCIKACPVDAIIGAPKLMHSVITDQCTGCDLCIPACPVDCIDSVPLNVSHAQWQRENSAQFRARYEARKERLAKRDSDVETKEPAQNSQVVHSIPKIDYIKQAILRAKSKKQLQK